MIPKINILNEGKLRQLIREINGNEIKKLKDEINRLWKYIEKLREDIKTAKVNFKIN